MMTGASDQNELMGNEPQVATRKAVGPPPTKTPPPLPGTCMTHADDVTEDWANDDDDSNTANVNETKGLGDRNMVSNDDVSDDEFSNQDSEDDTSDASEDAISVLAQAAVEEAMEAAVRQANDATQDSVIINCTVSHGEQEQSSMEANNSPGARPISVVDDQLSGSSSQHYPDNAVSEEDEGRWHVGENSSPPSRQSPTSSCSPFSANQAQTSGHSGDGNDDAQPLQEVKTLTCSSSPPTSDPYPEWYPNQGPLIQLSLPHTSLNH